MSDTDPTSIFTGINTAAIIASCVAVAYKQLQETLQKAVAYLFIQHSFSSSHYKAFLVMAADKKIKPITNLPSSCAHSYHPLFRKKKSTNTVLNTPTAYTYVDMKSYGWYRWGFVPLRITDQWTQYIVIETFRFWPGMDKKIKTLHKLSAEIFADEG